MIGPGLSALTRIFRSFKSIVHVRANDRTAALLALYTLDAGLPLDATIEAFRMIDPPSGTRDRAFCTVNNVKGLLFTVQKALPLIPNGGSIILNASIVASKGNPASSVYSATKAAVRSFARTWTMDLKERKIRVNALSPGPIKTPAYDRLAQSGPAGQQMLASIMNRVPMGRFGTPDEIARAAVFLASDDSTFVTGTELFVDGGAAQI